MLSNEARREIAKQARAMKEERRATLDARHKYLISRLVDAGTLAELEVEDALISDDKVTSQSGFLNSVLSHAGINLWINRLILPVQPHR